MKKTENESAESPLFKDIRNRLNEEMLAKLESLPRRMLIALTKACEDFQEEGKKDIDWTETTPMLIPVIEKLLSSATGLEMLQKLPKRMSLHVDTFKYTYSGVKKVVKKQYTESSLKNRLLRTLASRETLLTQIFKADRSDIFEYFDAKIYNYELKADPNRKKRRKAYRKPPSHKLAPTLITIDHIREIKTWGKLGKMEIEGDRMFPNVKTVLSPNASNNFFIMPEWLNLFKTRFLNTQIDVQNRGLDGELYFNMVPEKGPKEGSWVYPVVSSYSPKQCPVRRAAPKHIAKTPCL